MIIDKNPFSSKTGLEKLYKVQVENIGNVSEVYLNNFFSKAGPVKHIQHNGSLAIITYDSHKYAEKALKFNGRLLGNTKPLKITSINTKKKQDQKPEQIPQNNLSNRGKLISDWEKFRQFSEKALRIDGKQAQIIKPQSQFQFEVKAFLETMSNIRLRVIKQAQKSTSIQKIILESLIIFQLIVIEAILKLKFKNILHLYAFDINPETNSIFIRLINLLAYRDQFMISNPGKLLILGVSLYHSLHFSQQQSKLLCDNANAENAIKKIMKKHDLLNLYLQLDTYQKIKNEQVCLETENLRWIIKQDHKAEWGYSTNKHLSEKLEEESQNIFSETKLQLCRKQFSGYGPKNIPFRAIFNEYTDNIVPNLYIIDNLEINSEQKAQILPFVKILGCNIALNMEKDQIFILPENEFSNYYLYTEENRMKQMVKKAVAQIKMCQHIVIFDAQQHSNPNEVRLFINIFSTVHKTQNTTIIFLVANEDKQHPDTMIRTMLQMLNIKQIYLLVITNNSACINRRCSQKFIQDYIDKIKQEEQSSQSIQYDLKSLAKKVINQNIQFFQPQIQSMIQKKSKNIERSQQILIQNIQNARIQHQLIMQKLQYKVFLMMQQAYKCSHQRRMRTKFKNIIKNIRNQNEKKQTEQLLQEQKKRSRLSDYSDSDRPEKSWERSR